jgi:general secretion pathway protein G
MTPFSAGKGARERPDGDASWVLRTPDCSLYHRAMTPRRSQDSSGFTLAEILIVVVIIGILASFVLPRFFGKTEEARLTAAKAQITSLATAISSYERDHGKLPTTDAGLSALLEKGEDGKGPYLENTRTLPKDPWTNEYRYIAPGEKNPDFDLWSPGPDGVSGTEDDIGNWQ